MHLRFTATLFCDPSRTFNSNRNHMKLAPSRNAHPPLWTLDLTYTTIEREGNNDA